MLKILFLFSSVFGSDHEFKSYESHSTSDYLTNDPNGSNFKRETDFGGIDLNSGAKFKTSCGALSFKSSLRSSLDEITDVDAMKEKVKKLSMDFVGGLPMMTLAYMSPSTAAMVKHFDKQASYRLNARLDQCAIMENYVDERTTLIEM